MRVRFLAFAALMLFAPSALAAPPASTAPIVIQRAKMMAAMCTSMGGKLGNGDRPYVYNGIDLNGDGREDWVMDSAGFGCIGKPNLFRSATGATLEIFTNNGAGDARSAYIGTVYTFRITDTKPAKIFVTLRGAACGGANKTCEKQLVWNAETKKLVPGTATVAPPLTTSATPAPPPAAGGSGFSGPAFKITAADKAAAFKAAGFKQTKRGWQRCADSEGADSLSYTPGEVSETPDLNKDGRPELWIQEGGGICYGNSGGLQIIAAKTSAGQWVIVFDEITEHIILNTKHNGWSDLQDGGPGMGPWGTYQFNGQKYVYKKP